MKKKYIEPIFKSYIFRQEGMLCTSMQHTEPFPPVFSNCNCGCGPDCCSHRSDCKGNGIGGCNHKTKMFNLTD